MQSFAGVRTITRTTLLLLVCIFDNVQSEVHSLEYIYTALAKPIGAPGINEFTAVTLLDGRQIDYYNSQDKRKIPRQKWMEESMNQSYWEEGTQSLSNMEWNLRLTINKLMDDMHHNSTGVHVLQRRCGCVAERQNDGKLRFKEGFDEYGYDSVNFLSFDVANLQWIAHVPQAESIKAKWDVSHTLNQYTKWYLEKECMDWLQKFRSFGEKDLREHSKPDIFTYGKKSNSPDKMILHCLATGFYPKDVTVEMLRNGANMTEGDGVNSTGVRPNGVTPNGTVETYQMRKSVAIPISHKDGYSCKVEHKSLRDPVIAIWNGECDNCGGGFIEIIIGVVVVLLVVVAGGVLGYYLYKRKRAANFDVQPDPPNEYIQLRPQAAPQSDPPTGDVAVTIRVENPSNLDKVEAEPEQRSDESVDSGLSTRSSRSSEGNGPEEGSPLLQEEEP